MCKFVSRIQYIRHAHDKIKGLEERTAPTPMDQSTADATQAAVLGPGMMGEPLMITNGPMGKTTAYCVIVYHLICEINYKLSDCLFI